MAESSQLLNHVQSQNLARNGPSSEFEKQFLKTFDEKGYKKKFGQQEK